MSVKEGSGSAPQDPEVAHPEEKTVSRNGHVDQRSYRTNGHSPFVTVHPSVVGTPVTIASESTVENGAATDVAVTAPETKKPASGVAPAEGRDCGAPECTSLPAQSERLREDAPSPPPTAPIRWAPSRLERELTTFRRYLDDLTAGEYVVIKGEHLLGNYETQEEALTQGYLNYGYTAFLVKKVPGGRSAELLSSEEVRV